MSPRPVYVVRETKALPSGTVKSYYLLGGPNTRGIRFWFSWGSLDDALRFGTKAAAKAARRGHRGSEVVPLTQAMHDAEGEGVNT